MRRNLRNGLAAGTASTLAAATLVGVTLGLAPTASAGEFLVNGGFESGSLGPWSCSGGTGSVVTGPVHSGSRALAGAASAGDTAQCGQTVTVAPDTTYTLSAYVNGSYVYLGVDGGGPSTWTPGTGGSYQRLSLSFTTGATQTSAKGFPVAGNTGNVFPALPASKVAIGMPATTNAGNGYVAPAEVDRALDCLTKLANCGTYAPRSGAQPNLRGLMTWSINWDRFGGQEFSKNFDGYFGR